VVARELERYLPFLATTRILTASVRRGVGREVAHEVIRQHAVAVALLMRENGADRNDLFDRLAADERLGLTRDELSSLVSDPLSFTGTSVRQVDEVVRRVGEVVARHPDAAAYSPGELL
jgi:adenylosuccinate lyase